MRITGLKSAFENIPTSCKVSAAGVITSINGNPFLEKCCLLLTRTLWHLSFDVSTAKLTTSHQKSQNAQSVPVFAKQAGDKTETWETNPNFSVRDPVLLIKVYISSLCNPIPPHYLWVPLPEFQSYFIYIFLTEAKFVQSMCWSLKSVKCWLSWKGNKEYWKLKKKISCQNG